MRISRQFESEVSPETIENLNRNGSSTFAVDDELRLVFMNDAWDRFALDNGGERVLEEWSTGRCILEGISEILHPYYGRLYATVLGGEIIFHEYECSGPDLYRKYKMVGYPLRLDRYALLDNTLLVEAEYSEGVDITDELIWKNYVRKKGRVLVQCSHCRRVQHEVEAERWDFIPVVLNDSIWTTKYELCRTCLEFYYPSAKRAG